MRIIKENNAWDCLHTTLMVAIIKITSWGIKEQHMMAFYVSYVLQKPTFDKLQQDTEWKNPEALNHRRLSYVNCNRIE